MEWYVLLWIVILVIVKIITNWYCATKYTGLHWYCIYCWYCIHCSAV